MGPIRPVKPPPAPTGERGDGGLDLRAVELLCSRLCHDLAGPLGAVRNGVELLDDLGPDPEAMALLNDSSRRATIRLRLFRLAYGQAGVNPARGMADARDAFGAWLDGSRVRLSWPDAAAPADCPPGLAKLTLNALMLGEECLPRGGTLTVRLIGPLAGGSISVVGDGPALRVEPDIKAALGGAIPPGELGPRTIQAYATGKFAMLYGYCITLMAAGSGRFEFDLRARD